MLYVIWIGHTSAPTLCMVSVECPYWFQKWSRRLPGAPFEAPWLHEGSKLLKTHFNVSSVFENIYLDIKNVNLSLFRPKVCPKMSSRSLLRSTRGPYNLKSLLQSPLYRIFFLLIFWFGITPVNWKLKIKMTVAKKLLFLTSLPRSKHTFFFSS